jgi:hypothetical protein
MIEDIIKLIVSEEAEDDLKRYARMLALYGIADIANGTRCSVMIPNDNKSIPMNLYAIGLAGSGLGKTKGLNFILDLISEARSRLKEKVNAKIEMLDPFGQETLNDLTKDGVTISDRYKSLTDSSTLKLMKVLDLTDYFSINYTVDEFAGKVMSEYEILSTTVIEIYDKGYVPVNLRATTKTPKCDNPIPMNMLAFGSPHLLFESDANVEKSFTDLLQAGLARRTVFVNVDTPVNKFTLNANDNRAKLDYISDKFVQMQDKYDHRELMLSDNAKALYERFLEECTEDSLNVSKYQPLKQIYVKNKSWLALKISGLIAVSNFHNDITLEDYQTAIDIIEDSSLDFEAMLNRPEKYELIVDWLTEQDNAESEYTLTQALPFYKEVRSKKQFWDLAKGYAYEHNIALMIEEKRNLVFYQAKPKKKTNLDEPVIFSYSSEMTEGYYANDDILWKDFHKVVTKDGLCYSAHCFKDGYRKKDNAISGTNLLILDIDDGATIEMAKLLFEEYTYLIATTKSHLKDKNGVVAERFRIVLPMQNTYDLDSEQYSKFMANIMEDLPIEVDRACKDSARFYYGSEGEYWYNEGILFDADKYIPNTQEEEQYRKKGTQLAKKNLNGISQYIIRNEHNGRNNALIKLGLLLVDKGYSHEETKDEIKRVNKQFSSPLAESEIERTIFKTVERRPEVESEYEDYEQEEDEFARPDK